MAQTSAPNPANYMSQSTRRIVIKEKSRSSTGRGPVPPTISREIVIIGKDNRPEIKTNGVCGNEKPLSLTQDNLVTTENERDGAPIPQPPKLVPIENGVRSRESSPVKIDPAEPQSHTVLSKTASPGKSKVSKPSLPTQTTTQDLRRPPRSKSTSDVANPEGMEDDEGNVIQKAKRSLNVVSVPRINKALPDGCKSKYERYTYLPGKATLVQHFLI